MSNWEPGDLALCVKSSALVCECGVRHSGELVRKGAVYEVQRMVKAYDLTGTRCGCFGLVFLGGRGLAERFIKVTPGADIKGIEEPKKLHEWGLTTSTNCFTGTSSATETTNDRPHHRPRSPQAFS